MPKAINSIIIAFQRAARHSALTENNRNEPGAPVYCAARRLRYLHMIAKLSM